MGKKSMLLILLVFLAVLLVGCCPKLKEGIVIQKEYVPARKQMSIIWTGKVAVPIHRTISAKWRILVSGHTDEGEDIQEWWEVPEEEWHELSVGHYVEREGMKK